MLRWLLAGLTACTPLEPTGNAPDIPDPANPCGQTLVVTPNAATANPHDLVSLTILGGSGEVELSLDGDGSLNTDHRVWVAGEVGSSDEITVTDPVCGESVTVALTVVAELEVMPRDARVLPGGSLRFDTAGGSGTASCALWSNASGATLTDDCVYEAGSAEGQDTLRFTDPATGQVLDTWVEVSADGEMVVDGRGGLALPAHAPFRVSTAGGSGHLDLTVIDGPLEAEGDVVTGGAAGTGRIRVTDRFTGERTEVGVQVLAPHVPSAVRDGERSSQGRVLSLGDVNGDGYTDAAIGFIEPSVHAHYGGVVAVYAGTAFGLDPTPVMVVAGSGDGDTAGRGLAAGDVDGDGQIDLVVGIDKADRGASNNGSVRIHPGVAGGFFAETPSQILYGMQSYERVGAAIALCDFDGDGHLDLAAGAVEATDRNTGEPAEDQGGIYVYRGSTSGFAERADFILYGQVHGEDGWQGERDLELGAELAAGDFDGDGLCDLAAGAPEGLSEDGLVLVFAGTTEDGLLLRREPVTSLMGATNSEFGRRLAVADLDEDGRAELAITAWKADHGGSDTGTAYLFSHLDLSGTTPVVPLDDAAWSASGTEVSDQLGTDLVIADVDGDQILDIAVSAYRAEDDLYGQGRIFVWSAPGLAGADATGQALWSWEGAASHDRFGQAFDLLGDGDNDGMSELFVLSGFSVSHGIETGGLTHLTGGTGQAASVQLPGSPAGHNYGGAVARADLDGDGTPDLVVGGSGAGDGSVGANAGLVHGWTDGANTPTTFGGGHPTHTGSDRFGDSLTTGDINGDGWEDLVVVARSDYRPSRLDSSAFHNPEACVGSRSSAGLLLVYPGSAAGISEEPALAWWGPQSSGYIRRAVSAFDHNGDGLDDIAVASTDWGDGGGFSVLYGTPFTPGATTVLCTDDVVLGREEHDRLGDGLAPVGDLDGDGCDELGVGATGETLGRDWSNQGVLRILWGWGGAGCPAQPELSTLALKIIGTELGRSIAGGTDIDQDGIPDAVVSGAAYRVQFAEHGAAWVVPGTWLRDRRRDPLVDFALPDDPSWDLLLPEQGLADRYGVIGPSAGGLFGTSVAIVHDDDVGPLVAVGMPQGSAAASPLTGGVWLYRFDRERDGLDPVPWRIVGGEATPGELGAVLHGGDQLLIGAPRSDVAGLDLGAAYRWP